ncbi:MAG: TraR/DksA family transcriptional regulator [Planctomycetota bacterium]|jgi:RNA polymerase-binding protein DksA
MNEERKIKSKLTPVEIQKFKYMLLAKREEILENVMEMEREALRRERNDLSNMPIHMADAGSDNYEIENTIGLMDSERKLLAEIDDALSRIEDGTYGLCEGTGKPIPTERLEAIPWARYCVDYASLLEKGLVTEEEYVDETDSEKEAGWE